MFELILVIFLLIVFAGFLTAAQAAILTFDKEEFKENDEEEHLSEKDKKFLLKFENIHKKLEYLYSLLQIGRTVSLVTASFLTAIVLNQYLSDQYENFKHISQIPIYIAEAFVISIFYWIFSVLVPKALGIKYTQKITPQIVSTIFVLIKINIGLTKIIVGLANFILIPFKTTTGFLNPNITEDEIKVMISEGVKSGAIDKTEHEIIKNIFEFDDITADEIMIPRTDMVAVELTEDNEKMFDEILKTGHTLVPVYIDSLDNIIGIIHIKDLLRMYAEKKSVLIKNLIRPAYFIPETKPISGVLKEMQKRGERITIVTDEYGGTEGVITLEDILSEIVGEIKSSDEGLGVDFSKMPDGSYIILGAIPINDFNEIFLFELPESDDYNTVAGFISYSSGKILSVGESFSFNGLKFELIKKIKQKMVQFKLTSDEIEIKEREIE